MMTEQFIMTGLQWAGVLLLAVVGVKGIQIALVMAVTSSKNSRAAVNKMAFMRADFEGYSKSGRLLVHLTAIALHLVGVAALAASGAFAWMILS
jgi:hypothetical protein